MLLDVVDRVCSKDGRFSGGEMRGRFASGGVNALTSLPCFGCSGKV